MNLDFIIDSSASFSDLIKFIYNGKKAVNANFSIRAFAKKLNVTHSFLSKVLNGEKAPSESFIRCSCEALAISEKDMNMFLSMPAQRTIKRQQLLSVDENNYLTRNHLYLLSILALYKEEISFNELEARCGIELNEFNQCINDLSRDNLISICEQGISANLENLRLSHVKRSVEEENNLIKSFKDDVSKSCINEFLEYSFVPVKKNDLPKIRRIISSELQKLSHNIEDVNADDILQIVCFSKICLK